MTKASVFGFKLLLSKQVFPDLRKEITRYMKIKRITNNLERFLYVNPFFECEKWLTGYWQTQLEKNIGTVVPEAEFATRCENTTVMVLLRRFLLGYLPVK